MRHHLPQVCRRELAQRITQAQHGAVLPEARDAAHGEDLAARGGSGRAAVPLVEQPEERDGAEPHRGDVHVERPAEALRRLRLPEHPLQRGDVAVRGRGRRQRRLDRAAHARVVDEQVDVSAPRLDGGGHGLQRRFRRDVARQRDHLPVLLLAAHGQWRARGQGYPAVRAARRTLRALAASSSTSFRRPTMYTVAPLFSSAVAIMRPIPTR